MKLRKFNANRESKKLSNKQRREYQVKTRTMILSIGILICSIILCTYAAFSSTNKVDVIKSNVGNLVQDDYEIKAYINNTLSNTLPDKTDGYTIDNITCTNGATGEWNDVDWGILITDAEEPTVCSVYFVEYEDENEFDYTGNIQTFKAPRTGAYKLEVWGAQGGSFTSATYDGYGGYSTGVVHLDFNEEIYVVVGGQGADGNSPQAETQITGLGGYNGGGDASVSPLKSSTNTYYSGAGGGGGATHVATESGLLSSLESYKGDLSQDGTYYISDTILIVSGGGGGKGSNNGGPGYGGGISGTNSRVYVNASGNSVGGNTVGGTQTTGYAFGQGQSSTVTPSGGWGSEARGGGGAGFYGGTASLLVGNYTDDSGAGGSGYIASSRLTSNASVTKHMYCYNCTTSNNSETKTESDGTSSCHDDDPTPDCAKEGNGYAKITLLSLD